MWVNTCYKKYSTQSVTTQSHQSEDHDWVITDASPTRDVLTQTDVRLTSGQKTEMLRQMRRAQSYEF